MLTNSKLSTKFNVAFTKQISFSKFFLISDVKSQKKAIHTQLEFFLFLKNVFLNYFGWSLGIMLISWNKIHLLKL